MRRTLLSCAALAASALITTEASAQQATEEAAPRPRRESTAIPVMTGLDIFIPNAGVLYVPKTPTIHLSGVGGASAARGSETFADFGISNFGAGGLGLNYYYSIGVDFGFGTSGESTRSFSAGKFNYSDGSSRYLAATLPAVGLSWHQTGYVFGAALVPRLEWFYASFTEEGPSARSSRVTGNTFLFTMAADVQACLEYNFAHLSKNSAICAYVAPSIYRDGFVNGGAIGLRWFIL